MKIGELIEYNKRIFKKNAGREAGRLVPDPFLRKSFG